MADARFFEFTGAKTLREIIEITHTQVYGDLPEGVHMDSCFHNVETLQKASLQDAAVFHNMKYKKDLESTQAGIIFVEESHAHLCPRTSVVLVSNTPYRAFAQFSTAMYPDHNSFYTGSTQDTPIHPTAKIGNNCKLESGVSIGSNVVIGDNCFIGANTTIGKGVQIGNECRIASNVTVTHTLMGNKVVLHTGVRIGQTGFGFHMDKKGHLALPQLGRVRIEDDVDIGANTTIDRGSSEDTVIGAGCRIDNLVMIGHNVQIGKGCVIVAQVGISGSSKIGDYSVIAGQVGIAGHLNVGKGVMIAAQSGITKDIPDGMVVGGSPAVPIAQWHRQVLTLKKIANTK